MSLIDYIFDNLRISLTSHIPARKQKLYDDFNEKVRNTPMSDQMKKYYTKAYAFEDALYANNPEQLAIAKSSRHKLD